MGRIIAIIVALLLAFLAFKFIVGAVKFVIVIAILGALAFFLMNGGLA